MANIIFDFDGTLADTFPLVVDVAYKLSPRTRRLTQEQIFGLRELPLLTALRRLGISRWYIPALILFVRRRLTPRMQEVLPCEDIVPVVKELHQAGHKLFVLTSNYKENVHIFLEHYGIEQLFASVDTVHFASVRTKKRALRKLIKRNGLELSESYYVGNEVLDVEAAEQVGIRAVATTWGGFNPEALKKTAPFAVLNQPKELLGLLQ